jgi:hypothetical protein
MGRRYADVNEAREVSTARRSVANTASWRLMERYGMRRERHRPVQPPPWTVSRPENGLPSGQTKDAWLNTMVGGVANKKGSDRQRFEGADPEPEGRSTDSAQAHVGVR